MKRHLLAASLLALPLLAFADEPLPTASASFTDASGQPLGNALLQTASKGTLITLDLKGLPPGPKAIHIHAMGHCDDGGAGFKHSGSHLNSTGAQHGLLNPAGPDAGDLPNIYVAADGTVRAQFYTTLAQLTAPQLTGSSQPADNKSAVILDSDGAALVIHAGTDDHHSQPIGGAGDRIACAVIRRS